MLNGRTIGITQAPTRSGTIPTTGETSTARRQTTLHKYVAIHTRYGYSAEYCHLTPDAHDILKYDLNDTSCYLEPDELVKELLVQREKYSVLIAALLSVVPPVID